MPLTRKETDVLIQLKLNMLNEVLGFPLTPYIQIDEGKYEPCPGNIHLDGAYGGWQVVQMAKNGTGETPLIAHGYVKKPTILCQLDAYYKGILAGRAHKAT